MSLLEVRPEGGKFFRSPIRTSLIAQNRSRVAQPRFETYDWTFIPSDFHLFIFLVHEPDTQSFASLRPADIPDTGFKPTLTIRFAYSFSQPPLFANGVHPLPWVRCQPTAPRRRRIFGPSTRRLRRVWLLVESHGIVSVRIGVGKIR